VTIGKDEATRTERRLRHEAEHLTEEAQRLWRRAAVKMQKPLVAASVAGALVLAAGAVWGASEAAVATIAAYAVFRLMRRNARSGGREERPQEDRAKSAQT
jgi:hypothetical protein